jgi:hypothetical protein
MKIVFECDELELYQHILNAFKSAKEADTWDVAQFEFTENSAIYITCCNNKYTVMQKDGKVYFGYEGTREGLLRLQPFPTLKWGIVYREGGELLVKTNDEWRIFVLKVVEYKTSTPRRWKMAWHELLIPLYDKPSYAVIMMGAYFPRRVVKYKNVYQKASSDQQ